MQLKNIYILYLFPLTLNAQEAVSLPIGYHVDNYDHPLLSYNNVQGFLLWPIWSVALLIIGIVMLGLGSIYLLFSIRKQNETLKESEAKYQDTFNNSLVGILIIQNQVIQFCDQELANLYGLKSPKEIIGMKVQDLVTPGSWNNVKKEIELLESAQKKISSYQFEGLRKDGSIFDHEAIGSAIEYQGKPAAQSILIDITDRIKANQAIRKSEKRYRMLFERSPAPIYLSTFDGKVLDCNDAFIDLLGYETLADIQSQSTASFYFDIADRVEFISLLKEHGSLKNFELRLRDKKGDSVWILEDVSIIEEPDIEPYILGIAIDITARKNAEAALKESEIRYRNLFQEIPLGLYLSTPDGRILDANPAFVQMLGYPDKENILSVNSAELFETPEDRQLELVELVKKDVVSKFETKIRHYSGKLIWVQDTFYVVRDEEGRILHYEGSLEDITERVQVGIKLQESKKRFERVIAELPVPVVITDTNGDIELFNKSFIQIFGYTLDDISTAEEWWNALYPDKTYRLLVQSAWDKAIAKALEERTQIESQIWDITTKDQSIHTVEIDMMPLGDISVITMKDITEKMQSEQSLLESKAFLQHAQEVAQLGSYELDIASGQWISSDILKNIFGIDDDFQYDVEGWVGILHPDDREMMENYFADDVLTKYKRFDKEYRIIRANEKEERWVHGLGGLDFDHQGNPIKMVGTVQDITERVQAEGELKQYTLQLEALRKASLRLTAHLSLQAVLDVLLEYVLQLVPADDAHIFTYDGTVLHFGAVRWADGHQEEPFSNPREDGLTYSVARTGESIVVTDMSQSPIFQNWPLEGAIVGLPLLRGKQVVGVMNVATDIARKFSKSELRILELLADQAAIAINNARLYEEVQQHAQQLEVLNTISAALSTSLDINNLLELILDQIGDVLPLDSGAIFLLEEDGLRVVVDRGITPSIKGHVFPGESELFKQIQQKQAPIILANTNDDPRFEAWGKFENINSWMGIPLIVRDTLIGFLTIDNYSANTYSPMHVDIIMPFAAQAAQAIENARLYERVIADTNEMEKRIQERTEELQKFVDLTAGREIRMMELKRVIEKLRIQLEEVGQTPVTNDPLIDALENDE